MALVFNDRIHYLSRFVDLGVLGVFIKFWVEISAVRKISEGYEYC